MASVIVRKSDNKVVDASDNVINYDSVTYENLHPGTNPIPAGEDPRKYMKDAGGNIIKRPTAELVSEFPDEKLADIQAKWANTIAAIPDSAPWKTPLILVGQALGWDT